MAEAGTAAPVPVHAVAGPPGSGKSARIAEFAETHPDWLGFVNHRVKELPNLVLAPAGCPCCTARVALQVALAKQLREQRPTRVYIEIPHHSHAPQLAAVLSQWPLSRYVVPADDVVLG